jgi:hypothetical protein
MPLGYQIHFSKPSNGVLHVTHDMTSEGNLVHFIFLFLCESCYSKSPPFFFLVFTSALGAYMSAFRCVLPGVLPQSTTFNPYGN